MDIIFAWSLKLMMLLLRLGQTSYHSDGEPRWEREGGEEKRGQKKVKEAEREEEEKRGCEI